VIQLKKGGQILFKVKEVPDKPGDIILKGIGESEGEDSRFQFVNHGKRDLRILRQVLELVGVTTDDSLIQAIDELPELMTVREKAQTANVGNVVADPVTNVAAEEKTEEGSMQITNVDSTEQVATMEVDATASITEVGSGPAGPPSWAPPVLPWMLNRADPTIPRPGQNPPIEATEADIDALTAQVGTTTLDENPSTPTADGPAQTALVDHASNTSHVTAGEGSDVESDTPDQTIKDQVWKLKWKQLQQVRDALGLRVGRHSHQELKKAITDGTYTDQQILDAINQAGPSRRRLLRLKIATERFSVF
jgi:hypothetical protein